MSTNAEGTGVTARKKFLSDPKSTLTSLFINVSELSCLPVAARLTRGSLVTWAVSIWREQKVIKKFKIY
jgi:hypothetical protein